MSSAQQPTGCPQLFWSDLSGLDARSSATRAQIDSIACSPEETSNVAQLESIASQLNQRMEAMHHAATSCHFEQYLTIDSAPIPRTPSLLSRIPWLSLVAGGTGLFMGSIALDVTLAQDGRDDPLEFIPPMLYVTSLAAVAYGIYRLISD